ncbi:response regulator [Clostridium thermarum]|uniref:response regulator n=1 Tax=Clostridium thermarum TaxID=1716543 RepID=UPI0013D7973A|nr:response regulator [Clostridium thermarum]
MYKLILVDDEEDVRKGIAEKLDWKSIGFEFVGEAENGVEALDIAEKTMPDAVITDIKMPFMDGITLIEKLSTRYPHIKIIILTGFDEFQYAQKAIKLNVFEYVLKPISSAELLEILQKIKYRMDEEASEKRNIEVLKEHYVKSLPLFREKFLGLLITKKMSIEDILQKSKTYGINLEGKGFATAVIRVDNYDEKVEKSESFEVYDNKEIMDLAVLRAAEEITSKYVSATVFLHNGFIVIILTSRRDDSNSVMEGFLLILDEIRQYIEKYYDFTVTIGMGAYCGEVNNIRESYESATAALDYRLMLGCNRVISISDMEPQYISEVAFDELKEKSLVNSIKVGTEEEMRSTIDNLFKEIYDGKTSFKDYQIYLLQILTTILKVAKDLNADLDNIFGANYNFFIEFYQFKDIKEIKKWFTEICLKIKNYVSLDRNNSCKLIVKKALDYVTNNYQDCNLTIDKLCRHLHISPNYFSNLFKKETKFTFGNYLTHIRMEKAKELLRTTDLKTLEIAKMVGYSEPNYFSYCFKKSFDVSPSQYRKTANSI